MACQNSNVEIAHAALSELDKTIRLFEQEKVRVLPTPKRGLVSLNQPLSLNICFTIRFQPLLYKLRSQAQEALGYPSTSSKPSSRQSLDLNRSKSLLILAGMTNVQRVTAVTDPMDGEAGFDAERLPTGRFEACYGFELEAEVTWRSLMAEVSSANWLSMY